MPETSLKLKGDTLGVFHDVGDSGERVSRHFCRSCGSPIFSKVALAPAEWVYLKAGTLDDPSWLKPQAHVWCRSAQPWVAIDETVLKFEKNPVLGVIR